MPFVAICPACTHGTSVDVSRLRIDGGRVACARCAVAFPGLDSLRYLDQPQAAPATPAPSPREVLPSHPASASMSAPEPLPMPGQSSLPEPLPMPERSPARPQVPARPQSPPTANAEPMADTGQPAEQFARDAAAPGSSNLNASTQANGSTSAFRFGSPFDDDPLPPSVVYLPASTPALMQTPTPAAPAPAVSAQAPAASAPESAAPAPALAAPAPAVRSASLPRAERRNKSLAAAVLATLCLGLIIQTGIWLQQPLYVAVPALRPALQWLGEAVGRPASPLRHLQAISIESFEIRQPVAGRLQATGLLRNRADYALAWPAIELSLTDPSGALIVRKVIEPTDYLDTVQREAGLAANSEFALELNFRSGELSAASFAVSLFYP